jgi:hypothetical protein
MIRKTVYLLIIGLAGLLLSGCSGNADQSGLHIRVVADGRERAFVISQAMSVSEFLDKQSITLGEFDKVYPQLFTPLTDNLSITVIRVTQKQDCQTQDIPFTTLDQKTTDLAPGESKVLQAGVNGSQNVCFNVILEDGVEKSRTPGSQTVITPPLAEIVAHGIDTKALEPAAINGTLVYLSSHQAHIIDGNSVRQRTLPTGSGLDGRVFSLSPLGKGLLFTRLPGTATATQAASVNNATPTPDPSAAHINELWALLNVTDPNAKPVHLLDDVLDAEWVPGQADTISYSTAQPKDKFPFYTAFNDLIVAKLNPQTGVLVKATKLVSVGPSGEYSWWGTQYRWAPDGKALAWIQADGIGLVDTKTGKLSSLMQFKVYSPTLPRGWIWTPSISWSPSGTLLTAIVHGAPESTEPADASPVFDMLATAVNGTFQVTLKSKSGLWARPQFSPLDSDGSGHLAYLQARDAENSLNSEYDLIVANRNGANSTAIFPGTDKPGLRPIDDLGNDLTWSPDGRQVLTVYQGDLWLIDIASNHASQLTLVGDAALPKWTNGSS